MKRIILLSTIIIATSCSGLKNSFDRGPSSISDMVFNVGDRVLLKTTLDGYPHNRRDWPGEMYKGTVVKKSENGALEFTIDDRPDLENFFNKSKNREWLFRVVHLNTLPLSEVDTLQICGAEYRKGDLLAILDVGGTNSGRVAKLFNEGYAKIECGDKCSRNNSYVRLCEGGLDVRHPPKYWNWGPIRSSD